MLDLLFYSIYKKIEKSGEKSLLVLNSCAVLGLGLTMNILAFALIFEFLNSSILKNITPLVGVIVFGIISLSLAIYYLRNKRFKEIIKSFSKKEINIERYSIGYIFFSALLIVLFAMIKQQFLIS